MCFNGCYFLYFYIKFTLKKPIYALSMSNFTEAKHSHDDLLLIRPISKNIKICLRFHVKESKFETQTKLRPKKCLKEIPLA